ncbi:MAG: N-acyl-L-amino acid amidohydrolase [Eggerthella lenta]
MGTASTTERIREIGADIESEVIALRRELHKHPELSGKETRTQEALCIELGKLGVEYRRAAGTGVIATIRGEAKGAYSADGNPAKRVALRADIDALPVTEQTGAPYASQSEGIMHACGHDCRMAMMLGAVRILNGLRDRLCGEVRVLFQPAEKYLSARSK